MMIMFCHQCGSEIPDDALFCSSCGTNMKPRPEDEEADAESEGGVGRANKPSTAQGMTEETKATSVMSRHIHVNHPGKIIAGIITATICAIAILCSTAFSVFDPVSDESIRATLESGRILIDGIAEKNYCAGTPYQMTDFEITSQNGFTTDNIIAVLKNEPKTKTVTYKATIENDFFKTTITGSADYIKVDGSWSNLTLNIDRSEAETIPVSGVGNMDDASNLFPDSKTDYKLISHNSDLTEDNGVYNSTATDTIQFAFWWGNDTADIVQHFEFDGTSWQPQDKPHVENPTTSIQLAGKKYEYSDSMYISIADNMTFDFSFIECDATGTVSANYLIDWAIDDKQPDYYKERHLSPLHLEGNASGSCKHSFGSEVLTFQLTDSSNQTSFEIETRRYDKQTLRFSVSTNTPYTTSSIYTNKNFSITNLNVETSIA